MTSAKDLSEGHELITTGGFDDADQAWSSCRNDSSQLKSNHEEANTWLTLHAKEAKEWATVVWSYNIVTQMSLFLLRAIANTYHLKYG